VGALFDVRAARALAELGAETAALRRFDRARSAFLDGPAPRDPSWTWWFDERELAGHHGLLHAALGNYNEAIPLLRHAVEASAAHENLRWALYIYRAHLLRVLLEAGANAEAEPVAAALAPMVGTIAGARTEKLLRALTPNAAMSSTLGDALRDIIR
jgi:tetratricopeptide (TPR) repeat protein